MFYLIVILVSTAIIALVNSLFSPLGIYGFGYDLAKTVVGVVAIIAVDGISALIIRRLTPTKWFSADNRIFTVSAKECRIYRRMKVKSWVSLVPELGLFTGFHKDSLGSASDSKYLARFLLESNYGVVIHLANGILGFLIAFIPICSAPSIWIPIFVVNLILSLMPVAILRYNSHTLYKLYLRSKK